MSVIAGIPDPTAAEHAAKVAACAHRKTLIRLDGTRLLTVNQEWAGRALSFGCTECDLVFCVPVDDVAIDALLEEVSRCGLWSDGHGYCDRMRWHDGKCGQCGALGTFGQCRHMAGHSGNHRS